MMERSCVMERWLVKAGVVLALSGAILMAGLPWRTAAVSAAEKTEKTTSSAKKTDEKKVAKYVGSSESKKYHKPSCEWVKKIKKDNFVEFASTAEAEKAGYTACKVCLPSKDSKKTTISASKTYKSEAKSNQ